MRLALLDTGQGSFGHRGLDSHDNGCIVPGRVGTFAREYQNASNVIQILLARFLRLLIVFDVVIAIRQPETASHGEGDYLLRILEILIGTKIEKRAGVLVDMLGGEQWR